MEKQTIEQKIEQFKKIREKSTNEDEISFCDKKISSFKNELLNLEKEEKKKKQKKVAPKRDDSIDYDFNRPTNKSLIQVKRKKHKISEDFTDFF
jgi:phenylalanyl-tRNA synthetase alpha subunit